MIHQPPRLAVFDIEEARLDHLAGQHITVDRLEIFVGSEIDDGGVCMACHVLGQLLTNPATPKVIERFAARIFDLGAHLKPVGLDRIHRAQQAIKARQYPQMILCIGERGLVHAGRLKPPIDIAIEGEASRRCRIAAPVKIERLEPLGIQIRKLVRNFHELAQLRSALLFRHCRNRARVFL